MISLRRALWVLSLSLVLLSAANAQVVLYGNLNATIGRYDPVTGLGPLYNSFSTGASPVLLADVKLALNLKTGISETAAVAHVATGSQPHLDSSIASTLALYADNAGAPGSQIKVIATISDSTISTNVATYDFPVSPAVSLAANTRYWLGLTSSNGSLIQWAATYSTSGTGNISAEFNCQTTTQLPPPAANLRGPHPQTQGNLVLNCVQNNVDPYLMQVTTGSPASVPALSFWAMFGLALLLMFSAAGIIRSAQRAT